MDKIKEPPAVTIRQPATANLMVDSADRSSGTWGNFQITRQQSILNGFFNRIGVTELVLEWNQPNIYDDPVLTTLDQFQITIGGTDVLVALNTGFYTVAQVIDYLKQEMTLALAGEAAPLNGYSFQYLIDSGFWVSDTALPTGNPVPFSITPTDLVTKLNIPTPTTVQDYHLPIAPDLRIYRYIDIVSQQLTYNQDLKDAATTEIVRDILARWYFSYDNQTNTDNYYFPIYMGYEPFSLRRTFSPPKQIRWDNIQPVGNLTFQVYNDQQQQILTDDNNEFLMTLQISEN